MDQGHHPPNQVLDRLAQALGEVELNPYPPEILSSATSYAHELINGVLANRAAINEAVELAKLFGSETSAKFVNGVLGRAVEASTSGDATPTAAAPQSPAN